MRFWITRLAVVALIAVSFAPMAWAKLDEGLVNISWGNKEVVPDGKAVLGADGDKWNGMDGNGRFQLERQLLRPARTTQRLLQGTGEFAGIATYRDRQAQSGTYRPGRYVDPADGPELPEGLVDVRVAPRRKQRAQGFVRLAHVITFKERAGILAVRTAPPTAGWGPMA